MVEEWKKSQLYASLVAPSKIEPLELKGDFALAQYGKPYVHSMYRHIEILLRRQFILLSRNKIFLSIRVIGSLIIVYYFVAIINLIILVNNYWWDVLAKVD